jgi:PPM family protein phosphatase
MDIGNIFAKYDLGLKKRKQEDNAFAESIKIPGSPFKAILMVADAWGNSNGKLSNAQEAEVILKDIFIKNLYKKFNNKTYISNNNLKEILYLSFFLLDEQLTKSNSKSSSGEKGTTCTIALILNSPDEYTDILIGHVGNSRAYLVSPRNIRLITEDDSLVWQYYTQGRISYKDITTHIDRNFITQALGCGTFVKPQIFQSKIKNEETLLLCTDGLYCVLSENRIKRIINSSLDLSKISQKLIRLANKNGGTDNVSLALYSRRKKKKHNPWKYILLLASALIILLLLMWKDVILYINKPFSNSYKNDTITSTLNKKLLRQYPNELKLTTNNISDKDFNIQIAQEIAFDKKNNVPFSITYTGGITNKTFLISISGPDISKINKVKFKKAFSTNLRFPYTGNYNLIISLIDNDNSKDIFKKNISVIVKNIFLIKPIFQLTMLTLRIINYEEIKKNILLINWMEGANDEFRSPNNKHIYNSPKLIPSKIKIKYINMEVKDYEIM